jgi:hypothetical protein
MGMEKETIETKDWKLLLDEFKSVGISRYNIIPINGGEFQTKQNNNNNNMVL